MGKPITNITIVGGGTAGWIVAALLNQRLQWGPTGNPEVKITLIESPDVGRIGVGEATVPTLKGTLKTLGISEAEFMQRTEATFKLGIWFKNWNRDENGNFVEFVHPFTGGLTAYGFHPGYSFKALGIPGKNDTTDQDFVRLISHARDAMEAARGPRALNGPAFGGALQYAYHIDATKLAEFFEEVAKARGVRHIRDFVVDVKKDRRGFISSLQLKENGEWPVELVIDCSGFRGLIINEAMKEPFISFSDYLINDRAIPIQIDHDEPKVLRSTTTSIAMEAGWAWNIPLQTRVGTGYVYSSAFKSDDEALEEFEKHLNGATKRTEPRVLKMRIGHNRRSWVKNCVAIGLSSGFIEPLESTAIMSVELQVRWLLYDLPTTDFEQPLLDHYNGASQRLYEEIRDFLGMHFKLSNRGDTPYWKAIENEVKVSDSLAEHFDTWSHAMPNPVDPRIRAVFNQWSIACILMGKNFYKDKSLGGSELLTRPMWVNYCNEVLKRKRAVLGRIADHQQLVNTMLSRAKAGESARRKAETTAPLIGDTGDLDVENRPIMSPPRA